VHQLHGEPGAGHTLDLATLAAPHADVHVLATGADARADPARAARHHAAEQGGIPHFIGGDQLRSRNGLGQGHAQAVCPPGDLVTLVLYLAAGVLLDADVRDGEPASLEGQPAVHAHDGCALETRRNRAIQVLFSRDVNLVNDVHVHGEAKLDADIDGLLVHQEGRRVVHLIGTDVLVVQ